MIRFHIGTSWATEERSHLSRALAEELYGSLGIEVDGVDISGGRLEDRLVPTTANLVEAVARLLEGGARTAAIPFDDGAIELVLARQGDYVTLSLVSLPRPARVLVRDLQVELEALARAAGSCGQDLLGALGERDVEGPAVQRLRRCCNRLARASVLPGEPRPALGSPVALRSRPPAGGTEAPALGFDLRDDDGRLGSYEGGDGLHALLAPGHVYLHAPDGEELCGVAGSPFLLLRDLADVGLRLLEATREGSDEIFRFPLGWQAPELEVDLHGGAVTVAGRTLRCPPAALARALFSGALDLAGALLVRNPRLGHNPYLTSLVDEARERIALCDQLAAPSRAGEASGARAPRPRNPRAAPPLAPGTLRRVSLRQVWRADVGALRRLHPAGDSLWALGRRSATSIALQEGTIGERHVGHPSVAGPKAPLLLADGTGLIACCTPGACRSWSAPLDADGLAPRYLELPGDRAAVITDAPALRLLDRTRGDELFTLQPPAASELVAAAAGELVAVGADNGLLYGLHAGSGQIAWRIPVGQAVVAASVHREVLLVLTDGPGPQEVLGFRAATGERLFRTEIPFDPVGEVQAAPGGWVIAGTSATGGELLGLDPQGRVRWRVRPNLGQEPPALLLVAGALFARGEDGVCRIERGKVRWNAPCEAGGAPALVRGLLALPGEELALLDAATGRRLLVTGATSALPPADLLLPTEDGLVVADREGAVVSVRLAGALGVIG